jgi:hypothetical protein
MNNIGSYYYFDPYPHQKLNLFNSRGIYVRMGWLPVKTPIGNFGLEGNLNFLADNSMDLKKPANILNGISGGHFDLLYQGVLTERLQLNARFGVGGGDKYHDYGNYDTDVFPLLFNFGASVQFFLWKNLYAEAGADFQFMRAVNHFMIRPALGMGWQFGRWPEYAEVKSVLKKEVDPSVPVTDIPRGEFTLSVGWSPMIPLYGMQYVKTETDWWGNVTGVTTLLQTINPLGAYLRAAYLPYRWGNNKLGVEAEFYMLEHINRVAWTDDDAYRYLDLLSHAHIGLLYQRILTDSTNLNVRAGAGLSNPYDFKNNSDSIVSFSINTGVTCQYFFWKNFYIEAGFDFIFSLSGATRVMLRPGVGIGWQFRKNNETGLRLNEARKTVRQRK